MNHVAVLKEVKSYLEEEICKKINSKIPNKEGQTRNPKVYLGMLPMGHENELEDLLPSFTLSISNAASNNKKNEFTLRIIISLWSPGTFKSETYIAKENENALGGLSFEKEKEDENKYTRDDSGYIELWNTINKIVSLVQKYSSFAGYKIDHSDIKYDQYRDSEGYPLDYYPYYYGYVDVKLTVEEKGEFKDIEDLL